MPEHILVPLDGSPSSEAAIPFARALAERTGATVTLFRTASSAPTLGNLSEHQKHAVEDSGRYLSGVAERLRAEGLLVQTAVGSGLPAPSITNEITSRSIDLLVMATHDPTGRQRWVRGGVIESVIRHVEVPVLVVCASGDPAMADRFRTQPLLVVPLDGSELAEVALPVAEDLATKLHGRLLLVGAVAHVGRGDPLRQGSPASLGEQDFRQIQQDAREYLEATASRLGAHVEVATDLLTGDPASEINRRAEGANAAAIVMATHGRTGLLRELLGSVARQVVHSGSTPVLLVHPTESHAGGEGRSRRIGWGMQLEEARRRHSPG